MLKISARWEIAALQRSSCSQQRCLLGGIPCCARADARSGLFRSGRPAPLLLPRLHDRHLETGRPAVKLPLPPAGMDFEWLLSRPWPADRSGTGSAAGVGAGGGGGDVLYATAIASIRVASRCALIGLGLVVNSTLQAPVE